MNAVGVLRVEVSDSGAGIEPINRDKVFGQFSQFNRNELQGGGRYLYSSLNEIHRFIC